MSDLTPLNVKKDTFNLLDLINILKLGWRWLASGLIFGVLCSFIFIMVVPAQYEAVAIVQPATVGASGLASSTTNSTSMKGVEVETVAQSVERLKLATFYDEDLLKVCGVKERVNPAQVLAKAMKPTALKGISLVQVSYRAESVEIAEACVAAVTARLAKTQASLAEPIVKNLKDQLEITKRQLGEAERFQSQIEKRAMTMDPSDSKFSQAMLMLNAALSKRDEILKLQKLYTEQSMQLSEPLTSPAKLFEPIDASNNAVFPKIGLSILAGALLGLILAGLVLLARSSVLWKRA